MIRSSLYAIVLHVHCDGDLHEQVLLYHWQELPQVSFLLRQNFCRDKYVFVVTKRVFRDKTRLLSQKKVCLSRPIFVKTNDKTSLFCRNKHMFVTTKILLSSQQKYFVTTNVMLLQQKFCLGKHTFVTAKFYRSKIYTCGSSCQ